MPEDPLWIQKGNWQQYEAYIFGALQRRFPDAKVTPNAHVRGLTSGRIRQLDVLVERSLGELDLKIVFDCKCYKRKVTVKEVESFLGMLGDVRVSKGVLVTTKGYTKGAIERVRRESRDVDLQILPPERLSEYQHVGCAWLWKGTVAAIVEAPGGWVVDSESFGSAQFSMYPLGHTRDSARHGAPFLYGNITLKSDSEPTMEAIATKHQRELLAKLPTAKTERLGPLKGSGGQDLAGSLLRVIHAPGYGGPEYSLYIDTPLGVLLLVLLCPEGQDSIYLPVLKWIGGGAVTLTRISEPFSAERRGE